MTTMSDNKTAGYLNSFVNFVGSAPVSKKADDEEYNNDQSAASAEDSNSGTTTIRRNTAKRGRLRGPKSVRKRQQGNNSDNSDDESVAALEAEENASDVEPPAVPRRSRTARVAKTKTMQSQQIKRQIAAKGIDSDSSSSQDSVSYVDNANEHEKQMGSGYDSDEDPAWKPEKKSKFGSAKKRRHASSDDDEDYRPGRGRGRGKSQSRGRGRGSVVSSKPSGTQEPSFVQKSSTNEVVSVTNVATNVASNNKSAVAPPKTAVAPSTAADVKSMPAMPHAKNSNPPPAIAPVATMDNYLPDLNPPHSCQKGDFILDRRDMNNFTSFPIWRIDSQRLLQKFEAYEKDGRLLHRAMCTYSSWPLHAQLNYTAIAVRYVSCTRGKEIVEVNEKYRPRPLGVRGAQLDELREAFTVYVQIILSQSLEPSFLAALVEEPDDYYTEPLNKVNAVLEDRLRRVQKTCAWESSFLESLKKYHAFTLIDCPDGSSWSQATTKHAEPAKKSVRFYGHVYNHDTLETIEQVPEDRGPEFALTASESIVLTVFHGLYHLMYKLCLACQIRVDELKENTTDIDDHAVLDACLRDQTWMNQMFSRLTGLLENADRVASRSD